MAHRNNGRWRVEWKESGKRKTKLFPKGTCKSVVDRFEIEIKLGRVTELLGSEIPKFSHWVEIWNKNYAEVHKTPSSRKKDDSTLKYHLLPAFGNKLLDEITPANISELQANLWKGGTGFSAQSVNNIVSLLSSILKLAVVHRIIKFNPCSSVKRIKRQERRPSFWTPEEADQFLSYCREKDWKLFQLCAFALTTGLRPGELQGLLRDCVDFNRRLVFVRRNWCTKTNQLNDYTKTKSDRKVPVPKPIIEILDDKRGSSLDSRIFPLNFNSIGFRKIKPMAIAADVQPIRFHDLRHTFASHLVMHGKHPVEIKELLGHRKLETTMKYMHLAEDQSNDLTDCLVQGSTWVEKKKTELTLLRSNRDFF